MRKIAIFSSFFAVFISLTSFAETVSESAQTCKTGGRFQQIVYSVLDRNHALNESSFGLAVVDRANGDILCQEYVQGGQNIYPASTIKTMVAFAVLRKVDIGEIALDDMITLNQPNEAVECRDWDCSIYGPGKKLSVSQLLWDALTVSNNIAADQLIDIAGKEFINDSADLIDARSVHVYRKIYNIQDPEPHNPMSNTATAEGFVQLFREIATGRLHVLSESSRAYLIEILRHQVWHDDLNAKFPSEVTFYHKTGETSRTSSDTGFYYLGKNKNSIAIVVGLQNFMRVGGVSGNESLARVGIRALNLTKTLEKQENRK